MNFKRRYFIIGLVLLVLLTISAVSASENVTWGDENPILSEDVSEEVISSDEVGEVIASDNASEVVGDSQVYDARIIARDINLFYDNIGNEFTVRLWDLQGNHISNQKLQIKWSNGQNSISYLDDGENYYFHTFKNVGNYRAKIYLPNSHYSADPVVINVKILKAPVKMIPNKWISTTKNYAILRVDVLDAYWGEVNEGIVRFIVNGKYYNVKVNDGIAVKKVLINKPGTYIYKAIFTSKNYRTKFVISHVFVKQAKSYYIVKFGNFAAKMTYKQYLFILNAKNTGKSAHITLNTGRYFTYKVPKYKTVKVTKTRWAFKKVLSYESFYYGDGTVDSYSYSLNKYYRAGWSLYGWYDKQYSDGYESYAKLKKKVKYTDTERVHDGYDTKRILYRLVVLTVARDGQFYKGDYLNVYAGDPGRVMRINLYTYNP